ncbi:prepilin-type N-terminal cleavage/methylation domain-containing protein [Luteolibacter sp. LG18]|uniref:PulJ/GspJ family protein n=1 Tax=Luteolibacter sp. LG18 TaxID=2819286 RepID=UPI002B2D884B|nr:hypothetical protein llg_25610 [Luteolibacter sp. LG18]
MKTQFRASLRRGFTLMELMVAMAITTIIVTILVGITSVSVEAWQRSRSEVRATRQGKAMTDSMAADFQAMVTRRGNTFEWVYANLKKDSDLPGNSKVKSNNAASLIFFTAATDRYAGTNAKDMGGDVSCVSYKLDFKDPVSGNSSNYDTFAMYRLLVEPNETFTSLLGQADLYTAFGSRDVAQKQNFVCENVYQFTLKFNVEVSVTTGSGATAVTTKQIVPVTLSRGPSSSGSGGTGTTVNTAQSLEVFGNTLKVMDSSNSDFKTGTVTADQIKAGRLVSVDISLTVLTDAGINQIRVRSFKNDTEKAQFVAKNSYQFSKLVEITSM